MDSGCFGAGMAGGGGLRGPPGVAARRGVVPRVQRSEGARRRAAAGPLASRGGGVMPGPVTKLQLTIPNGAALSNEADLTGWQLMAVQMPAAWDAAALTFQARPGKNFRTVAEK